MNTLVVWLLALGVGVSSLVASRSLMHYFQLESYQFAGYFRTLKPQFTITSSMPEHSSMTFAKAQGYGRLARTARTCDVGDWVQFTFAQAVDCRRMQIATGNFQLPRFIFEQGYAEVSYDGTTFVRVGELQNGMYIIDNSPHPIKAVRLVCTSRGNGAKYVSIQPPTILPRL